MSDNRHMIHRQLFELTAQTGQPAWEWDRTTADFHRDLLLPVLEAGFSEADRGGEHLVIDRLEIDLGVFAGRESFVKEAGDRLRERLVLGLREKRQEASAQGDRLSSGKTKANTTNADASAGTSGGSANNETPLTTQDKKRDVLPAIMHTEQAPLAAFLYFLKEGRLPWWFDQGGKDYFGKTFQDALTHADIREIVSAVEEQLVGSPSNEYDATTSAAHIRCVQSLGDAVLIRILTEKGGDTAALQREWEMLRASAQKHSVFFPAFRQRYWALRFRTPASETWTPAQWETIFPGRETPVRMLAVILDEVKSRQLDAPSLAAFITSRLAKENGHGNESPASSNTTTEKSLREAGQKRERISQVKTSSATNNETSGEEGLYVEAAGLVLLHPFLSELFAATGCRVANEWTAHGQQTAIRLMGYLSDGNENLPEYRLVFQKVLAGMEPEAPLEAIAPVSDDLLASCDELLDAVLGHWSALKSTGRDGLREGFLQRPAMLRTDAGGIQLEMEKRAQDVLITRLPWGCSMVRLAWMEQMMVINWI